MPAPSSEDAQFSGGEPMESPLQYNQSSTLQLPVGPTATSATAAASRQSMQPLSFDEDEPMQMVSQFSVYQRARYTVRSLVGIILVIATVAACILFMWNGSSPGEKGSQASESKVLVVNTTSTLTSSTLLSTSTTSGTTTSTTTSTTSVLKAAKLNVLTWNQGLGKNSTALTQRIASQDAHVVAMCQQEAGARVITPEGWEQVYKGKITGMTKPLSFKLAYIYLTVLKRKDTDVVVKVPKSGGVRVSVSGKGSAWAEIQMSHIEQRDAKDKEQKSCGSVVVVCTHLPTDAAERAAGLKSVLADAAASYGCPVDSGLRTLPAKECWGGLHSVMVTGDMNYRLDGRLQPWLTPGAPPQSDAELKMWLRRAISDKRWDEMHKLDTIDQSGLMSGDVGFHCNAPQSPPTYKVQKTSAGCSDDKLENCFIPEDKPIAKKGEEVSLGWLDRVCWLEGSSHITLASDEWLYSLIGDSDHVPLEFSFEVLLNQDVNCAAASSANS